MATASTMPGYGAKHRSLLPALTPAIAAVGCGILFGLVGLALSHLDTRWLVYALAGLVLAVPILAGNVRRGLVAYFVVGLSLNVNYYLTTPEQMLSVGLSSPNSIHVPFVLLPAAALATLIALDVKSGRTTFRWGLPVSRFAILVVATATISAVLSTVRRYGMYVVADILQWFFIYIVALNIVRTGEDIGLVIRLLLVTLVIQCAVFLAQVSSGATFTLTGEIVQYAHEGLNRGGGTVGITPSGYAMFVEPLVFTALALWRTGGKGASGRWAGCVAAVGGVTLVLTLNRTSWATLLLGIFLVEVMCRRRGIARPLSSAAVVRVAALVILAALVLIPLISSRLADHHTDAWWSREELMRIAVRMMADNPIVGVGPGAFPYYVHRYAQGHVGWLWVVHNEYLLVWAERGLLGFAAWLAWMSAGLRQAVRATTTQGRQFQAFGIGCVAGFVGLLWEYTLNMFPPYCCYALLWCLFGLLVAGNDIYVRGRSIVRTPRAFCHPLNGVTV